MSLLGGIGKGISVALNVAELAVKLYDGIRKLVRRKPVIPPPPRVPHLTPVVIPPRKPRP